MVELTHWLHTLVGRHNRGEGSVGIILELLHSHTTSETTAIGQFSRMVEEIGMSLIVCHTAMVRKRLRVAERHDFASVGPGA